MEGDNVTGKGIRGNGVTRLGLSVAAGIRPQRSGGRSPVPTGVGGVLASATKLRHVRASDRAILCKPQTSMLIGITLSAIGMPFLIAWTIQLGAMLRRLEGGSGLVAIVATVGTVSIRSCWRSTSRSGPSRIRPGPPAPYVTRAMSDLGWISSMLIWPPLAAGMALTGVIIFKSRREVGAFPAWARWLSYLAAIAEPGQAVIIFNKSGPFAPNERQLVLGCVHLGAVDRGAEHSNVQDARPAASPGDRRPQSRTRTVLTEQSRAGTPACPLTHRY